MSFIEKIFGPSEGKRELEDILKRAPLLIDVRSLQEFADGSVEGAINIPVDEIAAGKSPEVNHQRPVVVFCRSGMRADTAQRMLIEQGFEEVVNGGSYQNVAAALGQ